MLNVKWFEYMFSIQFLQGLISGSIVTLLGTWLAHRFNIKRTIDEKFSKAAELFRNDILTELKDFYPNCSGNIDEIRKTITNITLICEKFKPNLKEKRGFELALKAYKDCCSEISKDKCSAFVMYSTSGERHSIDNFKEKIDILLSFSNSN